MLPKGVSGHRRRRCPEISIGDGMFEKIVKFLKETKAEMRKVTWPTRTSSSDRPRSSLSRLSW